MGEMTDDRQWSWWAGEMDQIARGPRAGEWTDPEVFTVNEATREAVIVAARAEFGAAARIAIVFATQDGPFETAVFEEDGPLMEQVVEKFVEINSGRWGEDGFDGDLDTAAVVAALNAAFGKVVDDCAPDIRTWAFTEQRCREVIDPLVAGVPAHG